MVACMIRINHYSLITNSMDKLDIFNKTQIKTGLPDIRPGDIIRVHQKMRGGEKEKPQVFEGMVIAKKHGVGLSATITVRKESFGVGVERTYPLHSPTIERIEVVSRAKRIRRAKLYYLRKSRRKSTLKQRILREHELAHGTPRDAQPEESAKKETKERPEKKVTKEKPKEK